MLVLLVTGVGSALQAQSPAQEPRPLRSESEWERVLAPYSERARQAFPAVLKRFLAAKARDEVPPVLLIVTRRELEGETVDLLFSLEEVTESGLYLGKVVTGVTGSGPIQENDPIGIVESEIFDWAYREGRKPIEGFVVRRARNAIFAGTVFVVFELQADRKGRLIHAELASALVPATNDNVTDLLPASVERDGIEHLFAYYTENKVPERFAQVTLFYTFPEGVRVNGPGGE